MKKSRNEITNLHTIFAIQAKSTTVSSLAIRNRKQFEYNSRTHVEAGSEPSPWYYNNVQRSLSNRQLMCRDVHSNFCSQKKWGKWKKKQMNMPYDTMWSQSMEEIEMVDKPRVDMNVRYEIKVSIDLCDVMFTESHQGILAIVIWRTGQQKEKKNEK